MILNNIKYTNTGSKYFIVLQFPNKEIAISIPVSCVKQHEFSFEIDEIKETTELNMVDVLEIFPVFGINKPCLEVCITLLDDDRKKKQFIISSMALKDIKNVPTIEFSNKLYEEIPHGRTSK